MNTDADNQHPTDQAEQASIRGVGNGREVIRLRLLFLVPLAIAILAIVAVLIFVLYQHEHTSVDKSVLRIRASAQGFYDDSVRYDASALQGMMEVLKRDRVLNEALAHRDRQQLLAHSSAMFDEIKHAFSITHFYFTGTDRVNLLRAHAPNRYGDRIDRFTTLSAEKSGIPSYGVELGPLGTFTLRLVSPWYDETTHQLIGYVELGMEIDRVLQQLRDFFGVDVFVLVHKDKLDRKKWEDGMRTLGRTPDWDRFPAVVLGTQTHQSVPPLLAEHISHGFESSGHGELGSSNTIIKIAQGAASYRAAFLPLQDAGGHTVAHMVLLADVSQDVDAATHTVNAGSIAAAVAGILLFGFFYWQVGRVGRRIERDAHTLEELATHDGLTGLYNHKTFYAFLDDEVERARRYQHPFSLLMIDIDHFKHVNDTYGHQAGDAILRGLSERLIEQVRTIDRVCRYGGEEITVILPDTEAAFDVADRLRAAIEATPFDIGSGKAIGITVSIGLAACPHDADNGPALVAAADTALYAAKEGGRNRVCRYEIPGQAGSATQ